MKKIFSVLLVFVLLLTAVSCGTGKEPAEEKKERNIPDKKIVIMTSAREQYPEDYQAACAIAEKYPDNFVVRECRDSRKIQVGDPELVVLSREAAMDPEIGGIIFARATQFTPSAIDAAKTVNADIVTVAVEPECNSDALSRADLILSADWKNYANDMAERASSCGAQYIVMLSTDRHSENPNYSRIKGYLNNYCKENNIELVYSEIADPTFSDGIPGTEKSLSDTIQNLFDKGKISGRNIAVFSTELSAQKKLVEECDNRGLIYLCPSMPSAVIGPAETYGVGFPESFDEFGTFVSELRDKTREEKSEESRIYIYTKPLSYILTFTAAEMALDILGGNITEDGYAEAIGDYVNSYSDGAVPEVSEYFYRCFQCYLEGFELIENDK